jgi:hypothetical protein
MRCIKLSIAFMALALSKPLAAQKFAGVAAGVVVPLGELGRIDNAGYNITGVWQSIPPLTSAGFRIDASYSAMKREATIQSITERIAGLSVGTVIRFPRISVSYGYAIATVGAYNQSTDPTPVGSASSTDLGVGLGAGYRFTLGGRKAFIEARHTRIMSGGRPGFVPVTFGLAF